MDIMVFLGGDGRFFPEIYEKMHRGHDIYSGLRIEKEYDEMTDSIRR